ncbi:MAG: DUF6880 family protein [Roseiarcus sp.]
MADLKSARTAPRFDVATLENLAGAGFARGEAYWREGRVRRLVCAEPRVTAVVEGGQAYRVTLAGAGQEISGDCECPAAESFGFCKHMVATALAANAAGGDVSGAENPLARIRAYLQASSVDALVALILETAERDEALMRHLDLASASVGADDATLEERLRAALDDAIESRGYVGYSQARDWAAGVDEALDAIEELSDGPRAAIGLRLAEYAIGALEKALNSIDDSSGHCGGLIERAADIHLASARAAPPQRVAFARELFAREMASDHDAWFGAARRYADVLGDVGLAEYRRLAEDAWAKLPARSGRSREPIRDGDAYRRLSGIVDFFVERDGNVDARIALRAKNLSSSWSYCDLAEFCRKAGRATEALHWAEEGLWTFEDERPDARLVDVAIALMTEAGRKADAITVARSTFEKEPSLSAYRRWRKLAGEAARETAVALLETRARKAQPTAWSHSGDLLIDVLMEEMDWTAAWRAVARGGASPDAQMRLARASDRAHPQEAAEVFRREVDRLVEGGTAGGYEEAAKLVKRMAALQSMTTQAAWVAQLKTRFARKRNFMKLLT